MMIVEASKIWWLANNEPQSFRCKSAYQSNCAGEIRSPLSSVSHSPSRVNTLVQGRRKRSDWIVRSCWFITRRKRKPGIDQRERFLGNES